VEDATTLSWSSAAVSEWVYRRRCNRLSWNFAWWYIYMSRTLLLHFWVRYIRETERAFKIRNFGP